MKVSFIVFVLALFAYAEITTEAEYIRAVNTPDGLNYCFGTNGQKGHDAEYKACVRKYYPQCQDKKTYIDAFSCMRSHDPVNVSQKDRQRHKQIEEWKKKHK